MPDAIARVTDPLLILYRGALAGEHKSRATIEHYIGATLDYMEWAGTTGYPIDVALLTKLHVLGWLGSLWERTRAGTYSESSVRNRFVGFRCYVRWLMRNDLVPAGYKDPFAGIPLPKGPETFKQLIADDEVSAMLTFLEKAKRYRDVALVSLLYDTGMRAEEALTLKWTDFRDKSYKRAILGKDPDRRT
ncbi:MAG: tyrosine-type recombinase/integrase, partial [Tepidiformaceae bacterium]